MCTIAQPPEAGGVHKVKQCKAGGESWCHSGPTQEKAGDKVGGMAVHTVECSCREQPDTMQTQKADYLLATAWQQLDGYCWLLLVNEGHCCPLCGDWVVAGPHHH